MLNQRIHYRSVFTVELKPGASKPSVYQVVVEAARTWLRDKFFRTTDERANLNRRWFFLGGALGQTWSNYVTTRIAEDSQTVGVPKYWVLRLEHPDALHKSRTWRVDVALNSTNGGHAEISITVSWYLNPEHIGDEPGVPASSAPKIAAMLFDHDQLTASSGGKRLQPTATHLAPGDGKALCEFLKNNARKVPVILINIAQQPAPLNPDDLQSPLLGSAYVYWYDSADVHHELQYMWDERHSNRYQCAPNAIRIYQVGLDTANPRDAVRHRYFTLTAAASDPRGFTAMLVQSILRIGAKRIGATVLDFETLALTLQGARLQKLREAAADAGRTKEQEEYIHALEESNVQTLTALNEAMMRGDIEEEEVVRLQIELEKAEKDLIGMQSEFALLAKTQEQYMGYARHLDGLRESWCKLPATLHDALALWAELNRDKIVILPEAYSSAQNSSFQHVPEAWELMTAMSSHLHDVIYDEAVGNIEQEFKSRSGYEVALSEGKMTKADGKLMASRQRVYDGEQIEVMARTKLQVRGHHLRINYYPDKLRKLLVIGHCGDHDDTAGTRRRKEG